MSKVVVLGASEKPERYSYKAVQMLTEYGHEVIPVSPRAKEILRIKTYPSLTEVNKIYANQIDTLTMYVNAGVSSAATAEILELNPKRVIFNPGAENRELARKLAERNIETQDACTLVMLRTGQF